MLENERYKLWERARLAIIANARVAKQKLPDWYWDHWHILTAERKDIAERIIRLAYPETAAGLFSDWRNGDEAEGRFAGLVLDGQVIHA